MVSASTITPTGTRIPNEIGVRVLFSKEIDVRLYPYRKMMIGVKIVQSKKIGVSKHEEMYLIITVFAILFFICYVMALLNFIGLN